MKAAPAKLLGFDNHGEVYHEGGVVLRRVDHDYRAAATEAFRLYEAHSLHSKGIVETKLDEQGEYLLRHKALPMTFPAEWPGNMLKDAALFHLRLLQELPAYGLTLKDALPNNILFAKGKPCFIDFLSLVKIEDLEQESWLVRYAGKKEDLRTTVLRTMFVPAFLTPLVSIALGKFELARTMLSKQTCHPQWTPPRIQQITQDGVGFRFLGTMLKYRLLAKTIGRMRPEAAYAALERFIRGLHVGPLGGYSEYYARKNEEFPLDDQAQWKPKQLSVHSALSMLGATSVLDVGANTGWFSRLAERMGAEVISTDVDEASLERLYQRVKQDQLRITPLKISFGDLERAIPISSKNPDDTLLFAPPIQRLGCDIVMMLGLIHHLVLGEGRTLDSVLAVLKKLSRRAVLIEFVDMNDPLISGNPAFFPNISKATARSYGLETLLETARRYWTSHKILPSHPDTRTLVLFH
jgi:SAM-dependent methyltransferase